MPVTALNILVIVKNINMFLKIYYILVPCTGLKSTPTHPGRPQSPINLLTLSPSIISLFGHHHLICDQNCVYASSWKIYVKIEVCVNFLFLASFARSSFSQIILLTCWNFWQTVSKSWILTYIGAYVRTLHNILCRSFAEILHDMATAECQKPAELVTSSLKHASRLRTIRADLSVVSEIFFCSNCQGTNTTLLNLKEGIQGMFSVR